MAGRASGYPVDPPWPPPAMGELAPGAAAPPMGDRVAFIDFVVGRYGDAESYAADRWKSARRLIAEGDLGGCVPDAEPEAEVRRTTSRTLAAWLLTPREAFIPESFRSSAYRSCALPLGHDQTISAPYMVTRMTGAARPEPGQSVLEIGTGSGYQTAMLAVLTDRVRTIEYVGPLAARAGETFEQLAPERPWLKGIRRRSGNGYTGWEEGAPYDRIVVTCAIDHPPPALLDQLAPGGMLILPLGGPGVQILSAIRRRRDDQEEAPKGGWQPTDRLAENGGRFDIANVYGDGTRVVFVPFVH